MAKFCTKCGKPLVEGQACNCGNPEKQEVETLTFEQPSAAEFQQASTMNQTMGAVMQPVMTNPNIQQSKANNLFNECLDIIKKFFKKPVNTIEENANENKMVHAIIMIALNALAAGLFVILLLKESIELVYALMLSSSGLGSYGSLTDPTKIELPYFKYFIISALIVAATTAVIALLTWLIVNKIFKTQTNYKRMLTIYGFSSIISTIGLLLATVCVYIDVRVALGVLVVGQLLNQHYVSVTLPAACNNADKNKLGYAVVISLVASIVIIGFIISKVFA